jgi:Protein of unknown function (DUF1538)
MVADRVRDLTGGGVRPVTLRVVVAAGVAAGLALGAVRVVVGVRLEYSLLLLILLLSLRAPRPVVALAYDTGPMATTIVTVPLISALGSASRRPSPAARRWRMALVWSCWPSLSPVVSVLALTKVQAVVARIRSGGEKR